MKTGVRASGWAALLRSVAIGLAVADGAIAIGFRDVDAALMTIGTVAGIALLRYRRGRAGTALLTILFALTLFWCGLGAIQNISHGAGFFAAVLTIELAVAAVTGLVAAVCWLAHAAEGSVRTIAIACVALLVLGVAASAASSGTGHTARGRGDIEVVGAHSRFVPDRIEATAGRITVDLTNRDFFWHTFTIRKLHVNLDVATRGRASVTFAAAPGTYTFVCLIHEPTGMKGVLVVR
jgi:plastocyanin